MALPNDIQEIFFETLNGDKSIAEFEQWLYADNRLETILKSDDYLELISYGYQTDTARKWLFKLFEKHIDKGEFEKRRIRKLLTRVLNKEKESPKILMTFYDLYCKGYYFLDNLGLGYGLALEVPRIKNTTADSWEELTNEQQKNLLNSFYPDIEKEIEKVITWLDKGKVILTGVNEGHNHFKYIDNRTEEEKEPTGYKISKTGKSV